MAKTTKKIKSPRPLPRGKGEGKSALAEAKTVAELKAALLAVLDLPA